MVEVSPEPNPEVSVIEPPFLGNLDDTPELLIVPPLRKKPVPDTDTALEALLIDHLTVLLDKYLNVLRILKPILHPLFTYCKILYAITQR
jgi:hypothetical protein